MQRAVAVTAVKMARVFGKSKSKQLNIKRFTKSNEQNLPIIFEVAVLAHCVIGSSPPELFVLLVLLSTNVDLFLFSVVEMAVVKLSVD